MKPKKNLLLILAVAFAYLLTARLGLLLALQPGFATPFWPPSGIAIASILLFGHSIWPGILIGSFIANLLTTVEGFGTSLFISAGIAVGSTLQPLAIGYLLRTMTTSVPHLLNTRHNVISFLIFTLFCCMISATISLATLFSGGIVNLQSLASNWLTWWLGDTVGIYVFTPFLFAWSKRPDFEAMRKRGFELFQLFILTLAISLFCFGVWGKGYPMEYALMPCLIWAAFRFTSHIPTSLLVLISIIAVVGTTNGYGPFAEPTLNIALLLLQAFIGVITSTTLILIAAINEIWHTQEVLEEYSRELKDQVKSLREKGKG